MDYYDYGVTTTGYSNAGTTFSLVWIIVSVILAIVGAILVYFLFLRSKDKPKSAFLANLKEFLDFKKMLIEPLLKVLYLFAAIFVTLGSFALFGSTGVLGIIIVPLSIILGNVAIRLVYEGILIKIMIWKNTTEINKKMK